MGRMRARLQELAYASKLYRMMISGPVPKALHTIPNDPWPGDAAAGQQILDGVFTAGGQRFSAHPPQWLPEKASPIWMQYVHGFGWLRDLRALGGDSARRVARSLLSSWLDAFDHWTAGVWTPPLLAARITQIIGFHDFVLASADSAFRTRMFEALVRQTRHLTRITPSAVAGLLKERDDSEGEEQVYFASALTGIDVLQVMRGLIFAGCALPDGEKALQLGMALLPIALRQSLTADGCVAERHPGFQARALHILVDVRHALRLATISLPPELPIALERCAGALRLFRHGDGMLALFNGSAEENGVVLDALLTQADVRGRAPKNLPKGGYERLAMGRTLLLVDAALPPPIGLDAFAHAGMGAFELSVGRERVFVNCGAHPSGAADEWHQALAATAAHTALHLGNRNNAEILEGGGMGRRAQSVHVSRLDQAGQQYLDIKHDAYQPALGITHQRCLTLCDGGDTLRGIDRMEGPGSIDYTLCFHVHPDVQTALIQHDSAVLLRLPSGQGLRLRLEGGSFTIEESLYYGKAQPRRTRQLVARGKTLDGTTSLNWFITREKK